MSELFQRITVAIYFFLNCSGATRVNPCAAPTIFNLFRFATIALGNRKLKTEEDAKWWLMSYRWVFDAWLWQCYAWSFHQFILAHPSPRSLDHHQRIWSETTCQTYTKKIYTDTCNQFICLFVFFYFVIPPRFFSVYFCREIQTLVQAGIMQEGRGHWYMCSQSTLNQWRPNVYSSRCFFLLFHVRWCEQNTEKKHRGIIVGERFRRLCSWIYA